MMTAIDMKLEAQSLAAEAKQLRIEHRKMRNRARKQRALGSNSGGVYEIYRTELYKERMAVRREARLVHLARMLLKGKNYTEVEQLTYEQVSSTELFYTILEWEPTISEDYVREWLGQ